MSDPSTFTFTATIHRTGSGDGRGGNARDRRKARRAGRIWRSLADVVRDGAASDLWGIGPFPKLAKELDRALNTTIWRGTP